VGPRIAWFGKPDGENLLYWKKDDMIRGDWKLYGGHRVWITRPLADESEDTYLSDNAPCELIIDGTMVRATAPAHPVNQLTKAMELEIMEGGSLRVTNFIKNDGALIYSGGVWSPTCVVPDARKLRVPLGKDDSTWDVVKVIIPRVFAGNVSSLEDDQAVFEGNDLVVTPKGRVLKRVLLAPKGRVMLECGDYVFEKYSPYNPLYAYPFVGCNLAVFVGANNFMAELETYGAETEIIPGQTIENTEYWKLYESAAGK